MEVHSVLVIRYICVFSESNYYYLKECILGWDGRNWTYNTEYAMPLTCIYNIQLILYSFIHIRINTHLFDWFQKYTDHSSLFITCKTYSKQHITFPLWSNVSRTSHACCNYLVLDIKHINVGLVNICINY